MVEEQNPIGEEGIKMNDYANLISLGYDYGSTPSLRATSQNYRGHVEERINHYHRNNPEYKIDKNLSDSQSIVATHKNQVIMGIRGTMIKPRDIEADIRVAKDYNYDGKMFEENMKKYGQIREKYPHKKHIIVGHSLGSQSAKQISQKYHLESHLFNMFDIGTGKKYDEKPNGKRTYYHGRWKGLVDPLSVYSHGYKGKHKIIDTDHWNMHTIHNFTRDRRISRREIARPSHHLPTNLNRTHPGACMKRWGRKICF